MSSDHLLLLRRPLAPKRFPPIMKTPPARPSVKDVKAAVMELSSTVSVMQSLLLDQSEAGMMGSSRKEADSPAPQAAPPTPLLPDTSTLLTDRITEGFPCKPPRTRPKNLLLELLQSDSQFLAPPPSFCLSDFLQSHNGSQHNSESPPV